MAFKKLKLWFDKDLAILLADRILQHDKSFNKKAFVKFVNDKVDPLELKDRVEVICDGLDQYLGKSYAENITILLKTLGPENEEETGMFNNFYWIMPIAKYIEKYGLEDLDLSIKAMVEVTKRNTSEYTIRPFLEKYPKKMIKKMLQWSKNKNKHVRRLASEGGRPRLPWASKMQQFIDNPNPLIPILENLKDDTSKYVQNSVAIVSTIF